MNDTAMYFIKFLRDIVLITIAVVGLWWVASPSAEANERVLAGTGSIICATEAAALQVLAADVEYDGSVGKCISLPHPIVLTELGGCGFLNPICPWQMDTGDIVYAAKSFLN